MMKRTPGWQGKLCRMHSSFVSVWLEVSLIPSVVTPALSQNGVLYLFSLLSGELDIQGFTNMYGFFLKIEGELSFFYPDFSL